MKDVRDWMDAIEKAGELKRITKEVDYHLELGHVASMSERKLGPALLFENVKDYTIPVLISTITTPRRLAITLGQNPEMSLCEVARVWKDITSQEKKVKPVDSVSPELEKAIREGLVDNRLPCEVAWEIAKKSGISKMDVSSACEALEIKISSCQLGTF